MTKIPHLRWFVVMTLFVATGLSFFDRQVLSVLAPIITKDLRMDNIAYSWVVFAFILAYSVMFSAGGRIIDRLGTRRGLGLAVGVWSVASLLHSVAHSALQLGFFRFLLGFGEGGCFPGAAKGVMEWFPKRERATAMGIATSGGSAFGAVVAPPVVAVAAVHLGWRGAFLITGFLGTGWVLVWVSTYSRPQDSCLLSDSERSYLTQMGKGLFEPAGSREIDRPGSLDSASQSTSSARAGRVTTAIRFGFLFLHVLDSAVSQPGSWRFPGEDRTIKLDSFLDPGSRLGSWGLGF